MIEYFPLAQVIKLEILGLKELESSLNGITINGIGQFKTPFNGYLTFCDQADVALDYNPDVKSIAIIKSDIHDKIRAYYPNLKIIISNDPRSLFIDIIIKLQEFNAIMNSSNFPNKPLVSRDSKIKSSAVIDKNVHIEHNVTIGHGCIINQGVWLRPGVIIGDNTVIGSSGINLHIDKDGKRRPFPHLAGVIIGSNTSIGSSCVIVRGILQSTVINDSVIIGNLCNIGHAVTIKSGVWISSGTTLGGYVDVGEDSNIGMGSLIKNGLQIGKKANIGMGSVVVKNILDSSSVFGNPAKVLPYVNAGPAR